jgi:dCTP deaminase
MYLSNRDIKWAIQCGQLLVQPSPEQMGKGFDETSIDLHLDHVDEAKIWNVQALQQSEHARGSRGPEVHIGRFHYVDFARLYLMAPPADHDQPVFRRGSEIIVKPGGFLLWQTKEVVGTRSGDNPGLICFVDGKSTRARTGILVHLTAPTIHAGWHGKITLEIANVGPFHFVLEEDDVIAQLTVATISSPPDLELKTIPSQTAGQHHVGTEGESPSPRQRVQRNPRRRTWPARTVPSL